MFSQFGMARIVTETFALSVAANTVIAMRLTQMAFGTVDPQHEGGLMVTEKIDAATEATLAAARSFALGEADKAAGRAIAVYKRRVDGNLRRLTRG